MRVISFLNQKGGVGKTTLAINVARTLSLRAYKVLLVDADPQASAGSWVHAREAEPLFEYLPITDRTLHDKVKKTRESFDFVIIDSPLSTEAIARSVIAASNLILIPVQPNPYDIWAAEEPFKLIHEVSKLDRSRDAALIINRKQPNTAAPSLLAVFVFACIIWQPAAARHAREFSRFPKSKMRL